MAGLTLAWEYLTGYAVATDPSNREQAEWPPHPARLFMAMAAAYFETGEPEEEGEALRWLESLGDPEILLPRNDEVYERSLVTMYVPVNDKHGASVAVLQSAPTLTRSKQARTLPRVWVGERRCFLQWQDAPESEIHHEGLASLCHKVTRIGHSSSLVQMSVDDPSESELASLVRYTPDPSALSHVHLRSVAKGLLDTLPVQTQIPRILRFAELDHLIETSKGKGKTQAKRIYEAEFGERWKMSSRPPALQRPSVRLEAPYSVAKLPETGIEHSYFDTDLLVLRHTGGPRLPVDSALQVTRVLRKAVMELSAIQPSPHWISGHQPDGEKLSDHQGHASFLPLPFVGSKHADGSLLGLAIAFPRAWDNRRERGQAVGPLLVGKEGSKHSFELKLGALGVWQLEKADWSERRWTLSPETWTASPKGSTTWASATPVVLDQFPKSDRRKDRTAWTEEVVSLVDKACQRIGLPSPVAVDIDTTSWLLGTPRAVVKQRRLRAGSDDQSATLGDGFPSYPSKGTNAPRPQVHVYLQFSEPVVGPILIGAGRFLGYGLCQPIKGRLS